MDSNKLTYREQHMLNQHDEELFGHCACHIFAVTLKRSGQLEPSELLRLEVTSMGMLHRAHHVYVRRADEMFDIRGRQPEKECLDGLQEHLERLNSKAGYTPRIHGPQPVTENELLAQVRHNQAGAWLNAWNQFTGDQFVREAAKKAERVMERWLREGAPR